MQLITFYCMHAYRRLYCNRKYRNGPKNFVITRKIPDSNVSAIKGRHADGLTGVLECNCLPTCSTAIGGNTLFSCIVKYTASISCNTHNHIIIEQHETSHVIIRVIAQKSRDFVTVVTSTCFASHNGILFSRATNFVHLGTATTIVSPKIQQKFYCDTDCRLKRRLPLS